jgi:hypothetical protein
VSLPTGRKSKVLARSSHHGGGLVGEPLGLFTLRLLHEAEGNGWETEISSTSGRLVDSTISPFALVEDIGAAFFWSNTKTPNRKMHADEVLHK